MSGADSDAALVESVQKAGNVILLAEASYGFAGRHRESAGRAGSGICRRRCICSSAARGVFCPIPDLARVAAGLGHKPVDVRPGRSDSTPPCPL